MYAESEFLQDAKATTAVNKTKEILRIVFIYI